MQTSNIFSINILMFCDSKNKSKSSILLFFVKSKNTRSRLVFLFLTFILASSLRNSI